MKRIRIGKDISMRWEITTDGAAIPLEGRDLTIEIKSPAGIENNIPYRVDGNVLIMTFYGYEQKRTGEYSITLWEKKGKPGQNVVDVIRAFELVRTSQEEDDFVGGDLQIESVDLGTENFDILTEGGYRAINIDTLKAEALEDSVNINGKTYSNESFTITLPKANLDSAGVMSSDDKQALQEHGNRIAQINTTLDEHNERINAKITTDRIEDGAVTTEKIATSAFDDTLSVSGKIAPADVVGEKLYELDGELNGVTIDKSTDVNISVQGGKPITQPATTTQCNVKAGVYELLFNSSGIVATTTIYFFGADGQPTTIVGKNGISFTSINSPGLISGSVYQPFTIPTDITLVKLYGGTPSTDGVLNFSFTDQESQHTGGLVQDIGNLDNLVTQSKDNLVNAINEAYNHGRDAVDQDFNKESSNAIANKVVAKLFDLNVKKSTNLLCNQIDSGYYYNSTTKTDSTSYNNSGFVPVREGMELSVQYDYANVRHILQMRFVTCYDENKNVLAGSADINKDTYVVPQGAAYIIVSASSRWFNNDPTSKSAIVEGGEIIPYEPYYEPIRSYTLTPQALPQTNLHVYLPRYVYAVVGQNIELYNELVCLEAKKYHFDWDASCGVAYNDKFSIKTNNAGNYALTLTIYDDNMNVVFNGGSTIVVSQNLSVEKSIIPLGDSLSNCKVWYPEIMKLANDKISWVGTRYSLNNLYDSAGVNHGVIHHEGRSGWSANLYNTDDLPYTFDDRYDGVSSVSGTSNPFFDGSKFSLSHYLSVQGKTCDAIMLFLGTNDIGMQIEDPIGTAVASIKSIVDSITAEYPSMKVFVCNTIFRSEQNGYHSSGADNFASVGGMQFREDAKIIDLENKLYKALKDYSNVCIVPLAQTMDRKHNFGAIEVNVNPRVSIKETIAIESVHPQNSGYYQIADEMYAAFCAILK